MVDQPILSTIVGVFLVLIGTLVLIEIFFEESTEIEELKPNSNAFGDGIADLNNKILGINAVPKEAWMNSIAYCWYCKKYVNCECMDATCWVCGRPYAKDRCKEFEFGEDGEKI